MMHFTDKLWVDFVRHTASPSDMAAMQSHLDQGCDRCAKAYALWSKVAAVARRDAQAAVPTELLHLAKARFIANPPAREASGVAAHLAQLVFDSLMQPSAAGVRSAASSCRQLMYQTGSCCIDVRIESLPEKSRISLIGQIQDNLSTDSMAALPVSLVEGKRTVVATETNSLGEFHMEFERNSKLSLSIGLRRKTLVMPLPGAPQEEIG